MPVSRRSSGGEEGRPEQPVIGGSDSRKSKSRPTSKRRALRQKLKERYAKAREDAQLAGLIPTTPEEALKPEAVSPSVQSSQPMSELVAQAIKKGWAVEDGMKPHLVDEMVNIVMDPNMPAKAKIAAFQALRMADSAQWEKDHPVAPTTKGTTTIIPIAVSTNISATELMNRMIADGSIALDQISGANTPIITCGFGSSGQPRQVEASAAPTVDQSEASERLGDAEQPDGDSGTVPTR